MMSSSKGAPKFVANDLTLNRYEGNEVPLDTQTAMTKIAVSGGRAKAPASSAVPAAPAKPPTPEGEKKLPATDTTKKAKTDIDDLIDFEKMQFTFPERLFDLLKGGTVEKAMHWLPGGDAFAVAPKIFYDVVLVGHFQGTKFESFTRKLNRWGFKRLTGKSVPQDCIAYHHPLFKKDHPELLKMMRSGRSKFFVPGDAGGLAAKQAQQLASLQAAQGGGLLGVPVRGNPLLDYQYALAGKMGGLTPGPLQGAGLFGTQVAGNLGLQAPNMMGSGAAAANLFSQQSGSERLLDDMLRFQALQGGSQQVLPSNLGVTQSAAAGGNPNVSLRQLLAAQQQHAASQVNSGTNKSPQLSPYLEAQHQALLASQRASASNDADALRLNQLLAARNSGGSADAASQGNINTSLQKSPLGPQGASPDPQLLQLLLLQDQMERSRGGAGAGAGRQG